MRLQACSVVGAGASAVKPPSLLRLNLAVAASQSVASRAAQLARGCPRSERRTRTGTQVTSTTSPRACIRLAKRRSPANLSTDLEIGGLIARPSIRALSPLLVVLNALLPHQRPYPVLRVAPSFRKSLNNNRHVGVPCRSRAYRHSWRSMRSVHSHGRASPSHWVSSFAK